MKKKREVFISVDVETSGPIPGEFSMLTLGACVVENPSVTFTCSFQPISEKFVPEALKVSGLSLTRLSTEGLAPKAAMQQFSAWITSVSGSQNMPVFVGLNAPFDWSFVNYYFHCFMGSNPFGFSALDIKALYMGATGCSWGDTRSSDMSRRVNPTLRGDHNALNDALYQAELFRLIRNLS